MSDKLKPGTEALERRQYIWRHNQLRGNVKMMEIHLALIIRAPSTTPKAKKLAAQILRQVPYLAAAVKTRIDPNV